MGNQRGVLRIVLGWIKSICVWGAVMKYEIIKGSEKDFEGAPEWAMVRDKSNVAEYFSSGLDKGCKFVEVGDSSGEVNEFMGKYPNTKIIAERRPITEPVVNQQLTTEWLPEVGERIEYACIKFDENRPAIEFGKWYGGTVIAYHDGAVWTSDNGIRLLRNTKFRPMKS